MGDRKSILKSNGAAAAGKSTGKAEAKTAKRKKKGSKDSLAEKSKGHAAENAYGVLGSADENEDSADDDGDG